MNYNEVVELDYIEFINSSKTVVISFRTPCGEQDQVRMGINQFMQEINNSNIKVRLQYINNEFVRDGWVYRGIL